MLLEIKPCILDSVQSKNTGKIKEESSVEHTKGLLSFYSSLCSVALGILHRSP